MGVLIIPDSVKFRKGFFSLLRFPG